MGDIAFGFLEAEAGHVIPHGDALVEGLHDGKFHDPSEIGLSGEDKDKGVIGVHFEVGEEPKFFQRPGLEEVCLVDNEEDGFSQLIFGFQQGFLYLVINGALGEPGSQTEYAVDV